MTAKGAIKKVSIDASLIKPDEKEIVEDLVVAASADARVKAEPLYEGAEVRGDDITYADEAQEEDL
jgi:DNA-binding protein YbaB